MKGKQLPGGDHPHLHWLCGRVEKIALKLPYALITAGVSLHWMDWQIVLPLFCELLMPGSYLAVISPQVAQRVKLTKRYRKGTLDILPSLSYTYIVSLHCKYRKITDHGEIW